MSRRIGLYPGTFDPINSLGLLRYPYTQRTRSVALFGQADYKLTEKLTLTAGLRWSNDRISMDYRSLFDVVGGVAPVKAYSNLTLPLLDFKDLRAILDAIAKGLKKGPVQLIGFGTFKPVARKARTGRNPKTGDEVPISPRRVLTFRPSHLMKDRVAAGSKK